MCSPWTVAGWAVDLGRRSLDSNVYPVMSSSPASGASTWSVFASRLSFGFLLAVFAVCVAVAVRGPDKDAVSGPRTLRVAHGLPTQHPVHLAIERFAARLEELSGGRLRATIFANGQLGSEVQYIEQLQAGTLDIAKVSAAPIGTFVPAYQVFSLPFLFPSEARRWAALDGPVGQDLLHEAIRRRGDGSPSGLVGLAFYDAGTRSFYAKTPLATPDDIRARKWRVMSDPIAMDMVEALGGSPTPIAFGELYSALSQGVVDGAENNPPSLLSSRHYEVCRFYLMTEHSAVPDVLVQSARARAKLTSEEQAWVEQAARDSALFQRELWAKETVAALEKLRELGVRIDTPDRAAFAALTRAVRKRHENGPLGEWTRRLGDAPEGSINPSQP